MLCKGNAQIQVSRFTTAEAFLSAAGETDFLSLPHADGNLHPQGLRGGFPGVRFGPLELDRARRAMQDFAERHQDVALNVLTNGVQVSLHKVAYK